MIAGGIDLGGTKIEAQVFDAGWQAVDRRRVDTPKDYPALVAAMAGPGGLDHRPRGRAGAGGGSRRRGW